MAEKDMYRKQDVIFFLGAGASVDAGIPDTYAFPAQFEEYIKTSYPRLHESLLTILGTRQRFNERVYGSKRRRVDVEQLLETLRSLSEKDSEPLLDFYEEKRFCPNLDQDDCLELKALLESFIRERVIVKNEKKLEYLKELLKFDTPLEVYSTNYDTCIEQLSYSNYRRYTDGFDIYWNGKNFGENFDVKHYKLHGSVIWYQNSSTKECVKIPVNAFLEGKPINLQLIYGESVEPLLIYPAQKAEYVEPLTDLQLMFKERLFHRETRFIIVVGYSFRDDYVIHMLWDAARVNEDLHVILVSPNSHQIFEEKLKFTNREKNDSSRIHDRVVCLPYTFSKIVGKLKNHYVTKLRSIDVDNKRLLEEERYGNKPSWINILKDCIDAEFMSKAEAILKKIDLDWNRIGFNLPQEAMIYSFKGLLHSVIAKDGQENIWLKRLNDSFEILSIYALNASTIQVSGFNLCFEDEVAHSAYPFGLISAKFIKPLLAERDSKSELVGYFDKSLVRMDESIARLYRLDGYLEKFGGKIEWTEYFESRVGYKQKKALEKKVAGNLQVEFPRVQELLLNIERNELEKIYGGATFQFELKSTNAEE